MVRAGYLLIVALVLGPGGEAEARVDPKNDQLTAIGASKTDNYRNRSFDPATGRFLQRDPVLGGDPLYNPYCFPGNNPVTGSDPMGTVLMVDELPAEVAEGVISKLNDYIGTSDQKVVGRASIRDTLSLGKLLVVPTRRDNYAPKGITYAEVSDTRKMKGARVATSFSAIGAKAGQHSADVVKLMELAISTQAYRLATTKQTDDDIRLDIAPNLAVFASPVKNRNNQQADVMSLAGWLYVEMDDQASKWFDVPFDVAWQVAANAANKIGKEQMMNLFVPQIQKDLATSFLPDAITDDAIRSVAAISTVLRNRKTLREATANVRTVASSDLLYGPEPAGYEAKRDFRFARSRIEGPLTVSGEGRIAMIEGAFYYGEFYIFPRGNAQSWVDLNLDVTGKALRRGAMGRFQGLMEAWLPDAPRRISQASYGLFPREIRSALRSAAGSEDPPYCGRQFE